MTFVIEGRSAIACCSQFFYDNCHTNASVKLVTRGRVRTECVGQLCDERVVTTERVMQIHNIRLIHSGTSPRANHSGAETTLATARELDNHSRTSPGARKPYPLGPARPLGTPIPLRGRPGGVETTPGTAWQGRSHPM